MNEQDTIRALKRFFKRNYHSIYLRSALWMLKTYPQAQLDNVGDPQCRKCCQDIQTVISACTPRNQQIMQLRYVKQLKVKEVTDEMAISQTTYYIADKAALIEFSQRMQVIDPHMFDMMINQCN